MYSLQLPPFLTSPTSHLPLFIRPPCFIMFRLSSRQTFKALRSPLHSSLHLPSSRHVHAMSVPFSGPPTYDTIARRFSSHPNPLAFFVHKRQQEARDRGEFIDIHDISGVDPEDFDV